MLKNLAFFARNSRIPSKKTQRKLKKSQITKTLMKSIKKTPLRQSIARALFELKNLSSSFSRFAKAIGVAPRQSPH